MESYNEDRSVYNGHLELEILIDRPVSQVWKVLLDDALWVMTHDVESVSGELGTVGFITRVSPKSVKELNVPTPHYHYCKVIKVIPERQHLLKTYTEKEGAYGGYMTAFDDTRLTPISDSQTRVTFNFFMEARSEAIAKDPAAMNLDAARDGMTKNLENLKRIVESH